tara:strand:+ start:343 stop:1083 length:741 start_codon:yes stop_codon:yes gene_type:complete
MGNAFDKEGIRHKRDEEVYLHEDRYDNPKEYFKLIAGSVSEYSENARSKVSLLDIGCATGEFIYYLQSVFPEFEFTGIDVSDKLLSKASIKMPNNRFRNVSIIDSPYNNLKVKYDFVTMCGVLCIFDNAERVLRNAFELVKRGGKLYVFGAFNNYPLDVVMRYKLSHETTWRSAVNIFSEQYCENLFCKQLGSSIQWKDFNIGFEIERVPSDFMRSWTIKTENNPFQLVNGACQLLNFRLMIVSNP